MFNYKEGKFLPSSTVVKQSQLNKTSQEHKFVPKLQGRFYHNINFQKL